MAVLVSVVCALFALGSVGYAQQPDGNRSGDPAEKRPGARGQDVRLVGNTAVETESIRQAAEERLAAIESGEGSAADAADAAYEMERWLHGEGYPEASVAFVMIDTDAGQEIETSIGWQKVDVVEFQITEGPLVYLGRVRFTGAEAFARSRLLEFFPRGEGFLAAGAVRYRQRQIDQALVRIRRLYRTSGYAEVDVGPAETERVTRGNRTEYDVVIPIHEGPQFVVSEVRISATDLGQEMLSRVRDALEIQGSIYYPRQAVEGSVRIQNVLGRRGYQAEVDQEVSLGQDGTAVLSYSIVAGPRLAVGGFSIKSSTDADLRTRSRLIRSHFDLNRGDIVDFGSLESTESQLYSLGLFTYVDVSVSLPQSGPQPGATGTDQPGSQPGAAPNPDPQPGAPGTDQPGPQPGVADAMRGATGSGSSSDTVPVDIVVTVEEARSRYIEISGGYGSYELLRGTVTYTDRNVFGTGREWSSTLGGSFRGMHTETSVTDRILLGPSSLLSLGGAFRYREKPTFLDTGADGTLTIRYALTDLVELSALGQLGYSRAVPKGEDPVSELVSTEFDVGTTYDSRDSVVGPTSGGRAQIEASIVARLGGSDLVFGGLDLSSAWHVSPIDRVVGSFFGGWSTRYLLTSGASLPIQRRLFLGGENSVRAFGEDELGPVSADGAPRGGLTRAQGTIELRLHVIGNFHLALFYDVGMVSLTSWSLDGAWGHGPGIGVRYYLPVGPIRVDAAVNPGRTYAAQTPFAVHVAVGLSL